MEKELKNQSIPWNSKLHLITWNSAHEYIIFIYTEHTTLPSLPSEEDGSAFFTEAERDIKQ